MTINEKFIVFAGGKPGGFHRTPVPFELEVGQGIDVTLNANNVGAPPTVVTFNCVETEFYDNLDGTMNAVYVMKSPLE